MMQWRHALSVLWATTHFIFVSLFYFLLPFVCQFNCLDIFKSGRSCLPRAHSDRALPRLLPRVLQHSLDSSWRIDIQVLLDCSGTLCCHDMPWATLHAVNYVPPFCNTVCLYIGSWTLPWQLHLSCTRHKSAWITSAYNNVILLFFSFGSNVFSPSARCLLRCQHYTFIWAQCAIFWAVYESIYWKFLDTFSYLRALLATTSSTSVIKSCWFWNMNNLQQRYCLLSYLCSTRFQA